jgi:cation diffusion facilitator family transporter
MVVEIGAGLAFGSMALLADGLHMASHAAALGITAFAYRYARRHAADPRYSFGTGKIGSLAGYSGAVLLGVFAAGMAVESVGRLVNPVAIAIDQALAVAVLGLLVNGASILILGAKGHHHAAGDDHHGDDHHGDDHHGDDHHDDDLHVIADTLTSVLAIAALVTARYRGAAWLDPAMGIVGAVLVARWSVGLLRESALVLLDRQAAPAVLARILEALERDGDAAVVDLHAWRVGPGRLAAIVVVESETPLEPDGYHERLPADLGLVHVSVEVRRRASSRGDAE